MVNLFLRGNCCALNLVESYNSVNAVFPAKVKSPSAAKRSYKYLPNGSILGKIIRPLEAFTVMPSTKSNTPSGVGVCFTSNLSKPKTRIKGMFLMLSGPLGIKLILLDVFSSRYKMFNLNSCGFI